MKKNKIQAWDDFYRLAYSHSLLYLFCVMTNTRKYPRFVLGGGDQTRVHTAG